MEVTDLPCTCRTWHPAGHRARPAPGQVCTSMQMLPCGGRNCASRMMRGGNPPPVTCATIATPSTPQPRRVVRSADSHFRSLPFGSRHCGSGCTGWKGLQYAGGAHPKGGVLGIGLSRWDLQDTGCQAELNPTHQDLRECQPSKAVRPKVAPAHHLRCHAAAQLTSTSAAALGYDQCVPYAE